MVSRSFLVPLLLLLLVGGGSAAGRAGLLSSDGVLRRPTGLTPAVLRLPSEALAAAAEECEQTYGVLPCTTTVVGNLFLLVVYGFFMFQAAKLLSIGSEILLDILGPGIVGGLFLPILGALPDAILIFVSGLSGTKETAQEQVLIGMGLLAGSTVMLLTVLWGSCIVVGKTDLSERFESIDSQDTRGFSLTGSGVSTDVETSHSAKIMTISVVPFIIAQLPTILKSHSHERLAVLAALILAVVFLLSYCTYQIYQPWIQKRRIEFVKLKHTIAKFLRKAHRSSLARLLNDDGSPNKHVIEILFNKIDANKDGHVNHVELKAFILGIRIDTIDLENDVEEHEIQKILEEFDTSGDNKIDKEEFINAMCKWLQIAKESVPHPHSHFSIQFHDDFHNRTREEHEQLIEGDEEAEEMVENVTWMSFKAVLLLLFGTLIALAFADPLVDAVSNFSDATHIPSFFISFIAMPLATNSSESVSAIIFASRKKQRTLSLTFSEIYGGATMNNTLCLAVFLAIIYARSLTWDFSSEVLIVLVVCVIMGLFTSFRTTFPLWTCFLAYLLYPLSLAVVYVLDYVFGWS